MWGFPLGELVTLALALIAAGVATGLLAGMFGIGGGAVTVTALYQAFVFLGVPDELRTPLGVGTALAVIIPTAITSALAHRKHGAVDMAVLKQWWWTCLLGVIVASAIASVAEPEVFKAAFVVVAGLIAARLLLGLEGFRFGNEMPSRWVMYVVGFIIGLASALMGIAGGSLGTITMTMHGRPIHQAVATSAGLGVLVAVPGTIGYMIAGWPHQAELPPLSIGFVSVIGFLLIAPTSTLFAPVGARLAHRFSKRQLEIAFAIFLIVAAARFAASLIWKI